MHKNFWYPKFSETLKDAHEIFWHCETKSFRRKNVIPPFSSIKLFETKNFLKNSRIPLRKFSALWDIKISTENCDMPPLIHKLFFDTKKFPENRRVPLQSFSGSVLWDKNFRQKPDAPLLCMKIFDKRIFLKHQSVLQWNFSVQWDKNFDGKSWYPPLVYKIFSPTRIFLKHRMVPWRSFFRSCEIKEFSTKPWSFPLLCLKLFDTWTLPKHRSVLLRFLSILWDKDFSPEFSDIHFLCIKFYNARNFLKHRSVP